MKWDAQHPLFLSPGGKVLQARDQPVRVLQQFCDQLRNEDTTVIDHWVGFFSYDLGRWFEYIPSLAVDDLSLPLLAWSSPGSQEPVRTDFEPVRQYPVTSTFTREKYLQAVRRCLDYISAGDVFQINLSQRFTAPLVRSPIDIFNDLQHRFPARYPAYLDFGSFQIISNSPELFLKVERLPDGRRRIINRPIKGTRPVGPGMYHDLVQSEKDQAELAMIVDLQRNDLGRICQTGSVRVTDPRSIETHPTVLHGVATVEGILRPEVTLIDILRATFPCGSVTGCPKIRAMQIIDELEPVRRGVYCGAIGWMGSDGSMELSVAIRTMTIYKGQVFIPVGGGIVADSVPEQEYEETLVKARAMFAATGSQLSSV